MRHGKCPICGTPDCTCGGPSTSVGVTISEPRTWTGRMVHIPIGRGASIRMREDEARAKGLLPPEVKKREPVLNKMRRPSLNKSKE